MYDVGDLLDAAYTVNGVCSDGGGMGLILHVSPLISSVGFPVVAKVCKSPDEEDIRRFRREVRLLAAFAGNSKIVQIVDSNLEHDPPYFVMRYYADGDLLQNWDRLGGSQAQQESRLLQMIDCIQELHGRGTFHRDIKPQNFLVDGTQIVVSDLGLTTEVESETAFTRSSIYWGTYGYVPPEFLSGGFKHANPASDIFMLGKTMYVLLTKRDPLYLSGDGLQPPVFHIIERCCRVDATARYQSLAELRQSLVAAFDVLLGRAGGIDEVRVLLGGVDEMLERERKYSSKDVLAFVEKLALLDAPEAERLCREIPSRVFRVMRQSPVVAALPTLLDVYRRMVEGQDYSWSFAEVIADNMRILFNSPDVPVVSKGDALDLAICGAHYMNRFAAMDTCRAMITGVQDGELATCVAQVVIRHGGTFVAGIEPSECSSQVVGTALRSLARGI